MPVSGDAEISVVPLDESISVDCDASCLGKELHILVSMLHVLFCCGIPSIPRNIIYSNKELAAEICGIDAGSVVGWIICWFCRVI